MVGVITRRLACGIVLFLSAATFLVPLGGCSQDKASSTFTTVGTKIRAAGGREGAPPPLVDPVRGGDKKAVEPAAAMIMADAAAKEPWHAKKAAPPINLPPANQLTAGSFDDTSHFDVFHKFLRELPGKLKGVTLPQGLADRFAGRHLVVNVQNEAGNPVQNALVHVRAGQNAPVELLSRTDGRVIVIAPWDNLDQKDDWIITVTHPDGGNPVTAKVSAQAQAHTITLEKAAGALPSALELALVIDATGSMGDEIRYLQAEMQSIADTIKTRFPAVTQRYALMVYRDHGDEYVTRTFDFTESLPVLRKNLNAQSAGGGGDYPEAVDKALEQATQLNWTQGRVARILVHVADAPPHSPDFNVTLKHVQRLRKSGVAIYPVACSGYDPACEFLMRTSALLTGGQFLFLTDDSGIGNSHAEPNIANYYVERLNPLLVRMIASELSGRPLQPQQHEIVRVVGNLGQQ